MPADLLDIASENNLRGVKIHVLDGERFSLGNMDDKELSAFGDKARRLNLDIHIETSASITGYLRTSVYGRRKAEQSAIVTGR